MANREELVRRRKSKSEAGRATDAEKRASREV